MGKDFDSLLDEIGGYGSYQKRLMCLVVLPTSVLISLQVSCILFQLVVPDHYCNVPGRERTDMTEEQWKNFTIPWDEEAKEFNSCEQYIILWNDDVPYRGNGNKTCESYVYDRTKMTETVATTNDWVCEKKKYSVHILSIGMVGTSFSSLIFPYLADKYLGRRPMFFAAVTLHAVFSFALIFVQNFPLFLIVRILASTSFPPNYHMSLLISMELLPPGRRNSATFVSFVGWAIGSCGSAFFAWLLGDWRYLMLLSIGLNVYLLGLWRFLPESPRWLIAHNRDEEAAEILLSVSEVNGVEEKYTKEMFIEKLKNLDEPVEKSVAWSTVLKYPRYCIKASMLFLTAGACLLANGIIVFNIDVLPDHYFMNFFILSLIEIPSNITSILCVQFLGRRFSNMVCYVLSGIFSLMAALLVEHKIILLILVAILKWILTMGIYLVDLLVVEISPTTLRSTGMGAVGVFGTATMAIVPYIINSNLDAALNYWVMLAMCIFCLFSSMTIPETIGLPLPQTLAEANTLGNNRPVTKWVHKWNMHLYPDIKAEGTETQNKEDNVTNAVE